MKRQNEQVLKHLNDHKHITPLEALHNYGCFRLAARIYELRLEGHEIITSHTSEGGKVYAQYSLIKKA